jgi:hypothetical protein
VDTAKWAATSRGTDALWAALAAAQKKASHKEPDWVTNRKHITLDGWWRELSSSVQDALVKEYDEANTKDAVDETDEYTVAKSKWWLHPVTSRLKAVETAVEEAEGTDTWDYSEGANRDTLEVYDDWARALHVAGRWLIALAEHHDRPKARAAIIKQIDKAGRSIIAQEKKITATALADTKKGTNKLLDDATHAFRLYDGFRDKSRGERVLQDVRVALKEWFVPATLAERVYREHGDRQKAAARELSDWYHLSDEYRGDTDELVLTDAAIDPIVAFLRSRRVRLDALGMAHRYEKVTGKSIIPHAFRLDPRAVGLF